MHVVPVSSRPVLFHYSNLRTSSMEPPLELKDTKAVVDTKDQELKLARKKRGGVVKIKKNLDGKRKKPSIPR